VGELPRLVETLEPDLVTVLVGANDFWTEPLGAARATAEPRPAWRVLLRHSRLHRLFQLLRHRLDPLELETSLDAGNTFDRGGGRVRYGDMEIALGWRRRTGPAGEREMNRLLANLHALVDHGREHGVRLVLLTYPSRFGLYTLPNFVIREFVRTTGAPLVDLAEVFEPLCPAEACPELLFPDHHPTARGHRLIAETLLQRLPADEGRDAVR
jgi:lysophospholipase L1-like esterase